MNIMLKSYRALLAAVGLFCSGVVAQDAAEWSFPHRLDWEDVPPAALIPFPKVYSSIPPWLYDELPLCGRDEWELQAEPELQEAVQVAWQGLLAELPAERTGRRTLCKLVRGGASLPEAARAEGYVLCISQDHVVVEAVSPAGFFYGLQTLRQLLAEGAGLPEAEIVDYPAFGLRGFHHDCGRNFQTLESLKRQVDLASRLKINCFHWHLSDYPAFHLQSKKYPQLNSPEHRTRDKEDTYSYDDVRELIAYAKARHMRVIPEIDMPGHSDYFVRAFGFEMHTEQGMQVLEDVIEEFCAEVPAEDCPIFHFGADEVRVPNAQEFVARMSRKLISLGRTPMQWEGPWDLPVGEHSIAQRWVQGKSSMAADSIRLRTVDSSIGYSNLMDPALLVRRWFFMRPCGASQGDSLRLGAIFCTWPDRRVADKSLIPRQSPQWPGLCAMAERSWVGGSTRGADAFPTDMPAPDTAAARAFASFEKRLEGIRRTIFRGEPFPYWREGARENVIVGPVPMDQVEAVRAKVLAGQLEGLPTRKAWGGSLYFHTSPSAWSLGMLSQEKPGCCVWVITSVNSAKAGEAPFMLGFDAPLRSHQYYTGTPEPGEWSRCGTRLWINGAEIANPHPTRPDASRRANMAKNPEMPLLNEEIWWTQPPTLLPLQAGKNTLIIEQPYSMLIQSWGVSLIPLNTEPEPEHP